MNVNVTTMIASLGILLFTFLTFYFKFQAFKFLLPVIVTGTVMYLVFVLLFSFSKE